MNKGRCLMVVTHIFEPTGGIDVVNRLMVRALAERDYFVDILSLSDSRSEVDARYIDASLSTYHAFAGDKLTFMRTVYTHIQSFKYDFVFLDHVNVAALMAPLRFLKGLYYIVWLFGIEVFPPAPNWQGWLGLNLAGKRLAISHFTCKKVQERFPRLLIDTCLLALDPVRHTAVLPIEIHRDRSCPLIFQAINGNRYKLGKRIILHVGRMVNDSRRNKGQEVLLLASPQLLSTFPDAQIVFAGQGPDMIRLKSIAGSLPNSVSSQIFMPGFVDEMTLKKLYEQCYLFAMPSIGEGLGLTYLEAMSHAKPCLAANMDATPETITNGVEGVLVDEPSSKSAVAAKLVWFLSHPEEARNMGFKGYQKVRRKHLFPHFAERFWHAIDVQTRLPLPDREKKIIEQSS